MTAEQSAASAQAHDVDAHDTTVMDVRADNGPGGTTGSGLRFEDPHWRAAMPSLRPVGLNCMMQVRTARHLWWDRAILGD